MKPLITALVDSYNHEKYIEQALVSVLEQGLSPEELEIVVVDDGSTDKTASIIQKFGPRVKHVRKANGGQASAFNVGWPHVHGQIVTLLDGDDWWAKGKLERVAEALERNLEISAVGHGYYEFHEKNKETRVRVPAVVGAVDISTPEAARAAALTGWPFLLMGALTVRREVLEWIMPLPEEMLFMADSIIQTAAIMKGAMVLEEPLFYYRYHEENLYAISSENRAKLRRKCEMTELMYESVYRSLVDRGVSTTMVSALLEDGWIEARRARLGLLGGTRREAFHTEMRVFNAANQNPSVGYRLFKYVVVGSATLLLPARRFYQIRGWYARKELGHLRERVFRERAKV